MSAPQVVDLYQRYVASNPRVEMVHISLDKDNLAASRWASSSRFPWLTVLPENVKASGLERYRNGKFVPDYTLLSYDGKKLGSGQGVFQQAGKL